MNIIKIIMITLTLGFVYTAHANEISQQHVSEHVLWDKVPIAFVVPVGEERMISFPDRISLKNTDPNLTVDKVKILNNQGTLYVKALKEFAPIRLAITINKTSDVILVDLSSKINTSNTPLTVVLPEKINVSDKINASGQTISTDYVNLMRYAINQLYVHDRLQTNDDNIVRSPMYTNKNVPLYWDARVMAMPIASWTTGNNYITAILLKNPRNNTVNLDIKKIRGQWLAASLYPTNYVGPSNSKHDRTTLFLISEVPFQQALNAIKEVM